MTDREKSVYGHLINEYIHAEDRVKQVSNLESRFAINKNIIYKLIAFENNLLFLSIYTDYILMLFLKNYFNWTFYYIL